MSELAIVIAWAAWGFGHSVFATPGGRRILARISGAPDESSHRVRLSFNIFAGITLVIPGATYYWANAGSGLVVDWPEYLVPLQAVIVLAAVLLFLWTAKVYNLREFFGLPGPIGVAMANLTFEGPLKIIRHPGYLSILMFIWARDLTSVDIAMNIVISIFLGVGIFLEERKLVAAYGQKYSDYQKSTPMLLPFTKR